MSKRTVVLVVCLLVFALILVLNATLFVVHDIDVVDFRGEQTEEDRELIAEYSGIFGKNILTVSESKAKANIEKKMPYVKVENIERVFPSTVKITVSKRVEIIAITNKDNQGYALIDRDGLVLSNVTSEQFDERFVLGTEYITTFSGAEADYTVVGNEIAIDKLYLGRLLQIVNTFEQMGENGYRDKNFCRAVKNVSFEGDDVRVYMMAGTDGTEGSILTYNASENSAKKIFDLVSFFNSNQDKRSGYILTVGNFDNVQNKYKINAAVLQ